MAACYDHQILVSFTPLKVNVSNLFYHITRYEKGTAIAAESNSHLILMGNSPLTSIRFNVNDQFFYYVY